MTKIHLIMPMGGGGTRFLGEDFNLPKPLIDLQRKPFFYWSVRSLLKFIDVQDIIFVVLQEHIDRFSIDKEIYKYFPQAKIKIIPHILNGALLTCLEGIKEIKDNNPILFNDCDHAFFCKKFYNFCKKADFTTPDAALLTFKSSEPCYSYAQIDDEGRVIKTIEKQVISEDAICGAYYFKNKDIFEEGSQKYLNNCSYKEFFISGVYNILASDFIVKYFRTDKHISFGTPKEYKYAQQSLDLKELL